MIAKSLCRVEGNGRSKRLENVAYYTSSESIRDAEGEYIPLLKLPFIE